MISLDGVMQSPGRPEEDTSGGFSYGGWVAPYGDDVSDKVMGNLMKPSDLLLGRKTFQIWENYWPQHESVWPSINEVTKYVLTNTLTKADWNNSVFFNSLADIEKLKHSSGADLQVWGSSELIQGLLTHDLVDELWLLIHPLTLGNGKKLFGTGPIPAAFTLAETTVTPSGVIIAHYQRAGNVQTGTMGV